jgi:enoyl-CoA hydratase/carnithine racemase
MTKTVRFERHDGLGHMVLANPPKNLINTPFSDHLREAVHQASDCDIRALLVRAEGPNFSQGGDILDFIDKDFNSWRTFICEMHHSYRAIEALQIPTVVAVRGAAYGGAFELALACDLIVAAENCTFRCIEASVGSAPVAGGVHASPSARAARSRRATRC